MVSDHLYISRNRERSCAQHLVETTAAERCAISAVQALYFLYAICGFFLPPRIADRPAGRAPASTNVHLLDRRFAEAIDDLLQATAGGVPDDAQASALAQAFYQLGLQNLADQVRRSVRSVRGNQWMFRCGHSSTHPLRVHPALLARREGDPLPILHEQTAVGMDLSHSA